ncbi:MAG: enoyl-CoA hydratase-related protein [Smithellaceae bacterium]|nr:enoyl-CoA hydratase-related protein [Smithellaceae bacterium]
MKYKTLLVNINQGVGVVWMNRPELQNALDEAMIAELTAAMQSLDDNPAVRALVLAGTGESFCVGADPHWMQRMTDGDFAQNHAATLNFAAMMHTINSLKKPTIARVHGPAIAEGVGLVAACDMAVAAYDAEFCLSEVRLGQIPAVTWPYLMRAMGERTARRYCLSAERFTAAEAYRIGLLNDLAPPVELDARINELLEQLLLGGCDAQRLFKDWSRTVAGVPMTPDLINNSATLVTTALVSEEGREGIRSFLKKCRPAWLVQPTAAEKTAITKSPRKK